MFVAILSEVKKNNYSSLFKYNFCLKTDMF